MTKYPIAVFWSDEDEGYVVVAPDLARFDLFFEFLEQGVPDGKFATSYENCFVNCINWIR